MTDPRPRALVTGASSGIGAEFCRRLAAAGHDLILVARRRDRLEAMAAELQAASRTRCEIREADLSDPAQIESLAQWIEAGPPLDLLVNNAGFGAGGPYVKTDPDKQTAMINVHVTATARLTRAALPAMIERRRGAIVTVSSVSGFVVLPRSAMYCSTKAWQIHFTKALAADLAGSGVRAQVLCPGFTITEFHDTPEYADFKRSRIPRYFWNTAPEVVGASLRALERGRVVCVPFLKNWVVVLLAGNPFARALVRRYEKMRGR